MFSNIESKKSKGNCILNKISLEDENLFLNLNEKKENFINMNKNEKMHKKEFLKKSNFFHVYYIR